MPPQPYQSILISIITLLRYSELTTITIEKFNNKDSDVYFQYLNNCIYVHYTCIQRQRGYVYADMDIFYFKTFRTMIMVSFTCFQTNAKVRPLSENISDFCKIFPSSTHPTRINSEYRYDLQYKNQQEQLFQGYEEEKE